MTNRLLGRGIGLACFACFACGPGSEQLALKQSHDALRSELGELRQYNEDLRFRVRLADARNKVLTDLVRGLTADPEHFTVQPGALAAADASLQSLDRDVEALVATVRHSRADSEAREAQRQALAEELAQARRTIEATRAAQLEVSARAATLRAILLPLTEPIQSGRVNISVAFGQFSIQLPEAALFAKGEARLGADGRSLLDQVAAGLLGARGRRFRVLGPAAGAGARQRELTLGRSLAVLDHLVSAGVAAESAAAASDSEHHVGDRYYALILVPKAEELPSLPSTDQLLEPAADAAAPAPPAAAAEATTLTR